jgi:hypothetical protein
LGLAWGGESGSRQQRDGSEDQSFDAGENTGRPASLTAATLPSDRCKESLLMPHSTSPILRCH